MTTTPKTQRVTICGPNLFGAPETFHVHAEGCRDLGKRLYQGVRAEAWISEFSTRREVIEEVYSDIIAEQEDGSDYASWTAYVSEFQFFPCVTLPEEVTV
jgi:hypothetical protein